MGFPIHIDTISMGLPIVYFNGSQVEISKLWYFSVPEGCFNLCKQRRPWWNAALCCISSEPHCLPKYLFSGFQHTKGLSPNNDGWHHILLYISFFVFVKLNCFIVLSYFNANLKQIISWCSSYSIHVIPEVLLVFWVLFFFVSTLLKVACVYKMPLDVIYLDY